MPIHYRERRARYVRHLDAGTDSHARARTDNARTRVISRFVMFASYRRQRERRLDRDRSIKVRTPIEVRMESEREKPFVPARETISLYRACASSVPPSSARSFSIFHTGRKILFMSADGRRKRGGGGSYGAIGSRMRAVPFPIWTLRSVIWLEEW